MSAPTERLVSLPGGLRLPANKSMSNGTAIVDVPLPARIVLPLRQHAGEAAVPTVSVGDDVLAGTVIGEPDGSVSAYVHATTSGRISAIEDRPRPERGEPVGPCVVIDVDGEDRWCELTPPAADRTARLEAIHRAGIVGLGGAAYPAMQKITQGLASGIDTVILNGVECESYISCDDRLMRDSPAAIVRGFSALLDLVDASRGIVAVESDKPDAWAALRGVASDHPDERIEWVQIPAVYPSGAEDQLIYLVTGREVPSRGLPGDIGMLVQNVGTVAALHEALRTGRPLTSRIVTVTGEGVERPGNYRVRLGTPIADVAAAAGGYTASAKRLIVGGPMTGFTLTDDALPVMKSSNCLLITGPAVHLSNEPQRECIRCSECAAHCPVQLMPQTLYHYAPRGDSETLLGLGLEDCIECGCCDLVCPSHIPLTHTFREAKQTVRIRTHERQRAQRAEQRFKAHVERRALATEREATDRASQRRSAGPEAIAAILRRKRGADKDDDAS